MNGYNNFKIRTQLDGTNSRESKINDAKHILSLSSKMTRHIVIQCTDGYLESIHI